jgi:hypothetical protein
MRKDVVLRRRTPGNEGRLPAEEVRLLMAAVATRRKNMKTITMTRKVRLPVIRITGRKKTTMRTMTKITTKMKMTMASAPILLLVAALPVAVNQVIVNHVIVNQVAAHPIAAAPRTEASPPWIAAGNTASPAKVDVPTMRKEGLMAMTKAEAGAAAAVRVLRAVDVPIHPGDEPSPATPAANSPAVADVQAMEAGPADNVSNK